MAARSRMTAVLSALRLTLTPFMTLPRMTVAAGPPASADSPRGQIQVAAKMDINVDNAAVGPKAAFDTGPDQDSVRDNGGGTQVIECSDSFGS
jgi:hypothetical protein